MAMNPMQRRATRSFVIGIFIGLAVAAGLTFFFYRQINDLKAQLEALRKLQKSFYVATTDLESGALITSEDIHQELVQTTVPDTENLTQNDFIMMDEETGEILIDEDGRQKENEVYLKVSVPAGTIITKDMVSIGEKIVTSDIRTVEYSMINLPSQVMAGDFIDIRIQFPEGQDYVVLGKKRVEECNETTIWIKETEEELLTLNNAIIESYLAEGSKLYATKYTEPGMQEASKQTYPVSREVYDLINSSPNILEEAKKALRERYSDTFVASRNDVINRSLGDPEDRAGNVSSGISAEISSMQDARKEYLTEMGAN